MVQAPDGTWRMFYTGIKRADGTTVQRIGAAFEQGPNWKTHVVQDGNLMTGQNPQSSATLAEMVISALR